MTCSVAVSLGLIPLPPVISLFTAATRLLGSGSAINVAYGSAAPLSLSPCRSSGRLPRQAPNASAAAAWAAAIPQTNYSGNAALRSALAGSLSTWLTGVGPSTAVAEGATAAFDNADAFSYSAVQQSDVALLSAGLVQNLSSYVASNASNSSGTVTSGNFAVLVAVQVIVNTTAYATTITSSNHRRRQLLVQAEADADVTLGATHTRALVSAAAAADRPRRRQLQADTSTIVFALELRLQQLISAFQGVSTCNATAISSLYYDGVAPVFLAGGCSAANNSFQSTITWQI